MASKNRRPHPNGNFPPPPPKRSGRSTFDGCAVWAFAMLGAGVAAALTLAGVAYLIVA